MKRRLPAPNHEKFVEPYIEHVFQLDEGKSTGIPCNPSELHSAKNAWYRFLVSMGLNQAYSISMKPHLQLLEIHRHRTSSQYAAPAPISISSDLDIAQAIHTEGPSVKLTEVQFDQIDKLQDLVNLGIVKDMQDAYKLLEQETDIARPHHRGIVGALEWPTPEEIEENKRIRAQEKAEIEAKKSRARTAFEAIAHLNNKSQPRPSEDPDEDPDEAFINRLPDSSELDP